MPNYLLQPNEQKSRLRTFLNIYAFPLCVIIFIVGHYVLKPHHTIKLFHNDGSQPLREEIFRAISQANEKIYLSVYVLRFDTKRDNSLYQLCLAMAAAKKRGVDIRVLLHHDVTAQKYPGPDNTESARELQKLGIPVRLDQSGRRLHSKGIIIDDELFIGSHNWTWSALHKNHELSLRSNNSTVMQEFISWFDELWIKSTKNISNKSPTAQ